MTEQKRTTPIYRPQTALIIVKEEGVRRHVQEYLSAWGIQTYEATDNLSGISTLRESMMDIMVTGDDRNLDSLVRYVERGSGRQGMLTLSVNSSQLEEGMRYSPEPKPEGAADVMFADYVELITYLNKGKLIPDYMANVDAQNFRRISELEARALERKMLGEQPQLTK